MVDRILSSSSPPYGACFCVNEHDLLQLDSSILSDEDGKVDILLYAFMTYKKCKTYLVT